MAQHRLAPPVLLLVGLAVRAGGRLWWGPSISACLTTCQAPAQAPAPCPRLRCHPLSSLLFCSWSPPFSSLSTPPTPLQLIFADEDISIDVGSILVDGALRAGSPSECLPPSLKRPP